MTAKIKFNFPFYFGRHVDSENVSNFIEECQWNKLMRRRFKLKKDCPVTRKETIFKKRNKNAECLLNMPYLKFPLNMGSSIHQQ